jgi:hypothetical protein
VHWYGVLHGVYRDVTTDTSAKHKETASNESDFLELCIPDYFTYSQSVLLLKGSNSDVSLKNIGKLDNYLSLSPLIIDQSAFVDRETQTPEIYYYVGKVERDYIFAQYKNELPIGDEIALDSNKYLVVAEQNEEAKLNELFEQLQTVVHP